MNVVVILEHRFEQTPDGAVWTMTQFARPFWQAYLGVFDTVRVVARVKAVSTVSPGSTRADGDGVSFAAVPYYVGPWQYLLRRGAVRRAIRAAATDHDAVIARVSSTIANHLIPDLRRRGQPYAVEVVADPYDVFAPGANRHPLAPYFRWSFTRLLRDVCRNACIAAYVTREALQRRYPCPAGEVGFSDVEILDASLTPSPRPLRPTPETASAIYVGTLAQLYKAPDVLIDAVAKVRQGGVPLDLILVGDGQYRTSLQEQAQRLGIGGHVHFRGQLAVGDAVRGQLDRADLFVLPSHQEGLPRAMVEAMARGLPCIGSTVGGIPELLPAEDMVPPGDADALAAKLIEVVRDPDRLARMSERNWQAAHAYHHDRIAGIRQAFYATVRDKTRAWQETQQPSLAAPRDSRETP